MKKKLWKWIKIAAKGAAQVAAGGTLVGPAVPAVGELAQQIISLTGLESTPEIEGAARVAAAIIIIWSWVGPRLKDEIQE